LRLSFRTLQRGNAFRDALRRKKDAERPERHVDAERRTIVMFYRIPAPLAAFSQSGNSSISRS
ncbi:DUF1534 domain-containing protein, partial [Pseudomonas syringae pv. actinidiae]|nr:DUF1534 domain-containing protein [Pseudomonas syringae pv. actinidiae]